MANWLAPTTGSLYLDVINFLNDKDTSVATWFDTSINTDTNIPNKAKRWNAAQARWEIYNGYNWAVLSAAYAISISGNAATATLASNSNALGGYSAGAFVRTVGGVAPDGNGNVAVDMASKANSSGTNAYGTWPINITGASAGTPWSGISGKPFYWSGQDGQPTWLWGSNDGANYYVWNPANFSVNYANNAGNANSVGGATQDHFARTWNAYGNCTMYTTGSAPPYLNTYLRFWFVNGTIHKDILIFENNAPHAGTG